MQPNEVQQLPLLIQDLKNQVISLEQQMKQLDQYNVNVVPLMGMQKSINEMIQLNRNLRDSYQRNMKLLSNVQANECNDNLQYTTTKLDYLQKQVQKIRDTCYVNFTPEELNAQETVNQQMIDQLKTQKEDNLSYLSKAVKQIKVNTQMIKEELDAGDEVINEMQQGVRNNKARIIDANTKTEQLTQYIRKNKAPVIVLVLSIFITVLIWASKAFCSFGLTWQCPT